MPESLKIVVPSRKRTHNMPRVLGLLPGALIVVANRERSDYAAVVPRDRLLCHPDLPSLMHIRNWISQTVQEDCLVQIDDDLKCIRPLIGKQRAVRCPQTIAEVIAGAQQVSGDLEIPVFCWSRSRNVALVKPQLQPIRLVQPVSSSFGMRGPARARLFDESLAGRADLDWTFRTLLHDRIVYVDMRWSFDHGRIFAGRGGNVGLVDPESWQRTTEEIYRRWGKYVGRKRPGFAKGKGSSSPMSIRVSRHSPLAKTA